MTREVLITDALSSYLDEHLAPLSLRPVSGGCINEAATVEVDGVTYFVKWNDQPLPYQFEAEAAGLQALRQSGSSLIVPMPIAFGDEGPGKSFLILEHLQPGSRNHNFDEALGHGLAQLHRCSAKEGFGFSVDGYCGATPQPNGWMKQWTAFYRERRLGHQMALARSRGLPGADCSLIEKLLYRLDDLLGIPESPALIHGDLWSGNLHTSPEGTPALIDPAAYFAHREAELGMMVLFGGFGPRVFDAYHESFPLQDGWRDRLELYSLYHLLNHYNLFGGGYGSQAMSIVRRYVS